MDYVTLPLGDEAEQQGPTAPPSNEDIVPAAVPQYQPRPPATAPATAFPSLQDYSQGGGVPQFEITVSEPQKQGNGYQAFICYKVRCRTSLQQYSSPDTSVTRRFNHFVWLHNVLSEQYPGYIVPALPDKSGFGPLLNRFQEEFVEHRRLALQQFLARIAQHPVLCTSKCLQDFFEARDTALKTPEEKKSSFLGGLFKEITPKPHPRLPDPEFDAMGTYAKELEGQLGEVQKFMERLVCRRKELGSSLAELGLTLITFGNHEQKTSEPDAAATCKALQDLGSCCDHLAISVHQQAAEEARKALLVVEEWLRIVQGAKAALQVRQAAATHHMAMHADLDRKTRQFGNQSAQQGRPLLTESDIKEAQRRVEEARQRSELVGQRIREEMERLKAKKSTELRTMLCLFVSVQLKHGAEVQESWKRVLPSVLNGVDPAVLNT